MAVKTNAVSNLILFNLLPEQIPGLALGHAIHYIVGSSALLWSLSRRSAGSAAAPSWPPSAACWSPG